MILLIVHLHLESFISTHIFLFSITLESFNNYSISLTFIKSYFIST